jgi:hypothetical protein
MRYLLLIALVLFTACSKGQTGILGIIKPAATGGNVGELWTGKTVVYYGDSITDDVLYAYGWSKQLTALKDATRVSIGAAGRTLLDFTSCDPSPNTTRPTFR